MCLCVWVLIQVCVCVGVYVQAYMRLLIDSNRQLANSGANVLKSRSRNYIAASWCVCVQCTCVRAFVYGVYTRVRVSVPSVHVASHRFEQTAREEWR